MDHLLLGAAVIGASHVTTGRPCEDRFASRRSSDGHWTSVVVCDGCGSASQARAGADFISDYLASELVKIAPRLDRDGPGEWVVDQVVVIIATMREAMRDRFGENIREHAATIVGALASSAGGIILHVGDGIAAAFGLSEAADGPLLEPVAVSVPKNGEYANETFYVTAPDWIRHVRITPMRETDCVLLCTDGSQPLWYRADHPNTGNVIDTLRQLARAGKDEASDALEHILAGPNAARLSHDDKTAVFLVSERLWPRIPEIGAPENAEPKGVTVSVSPAATPAAARQATVAQATASRLPRPPAYEDTYQRRVSRAPSRSRWVLPLSILLGLVCLAVAGASFLDIRWKVARGPGTEKAPTLTAPPSPPHTPTPNTVEGGNSHGDSGGSP